MLLLTQRQRQRRIYIQYVLYVVHYIYKPLNGQATQLREMTVWQKVDSRLKWKRFSLLTHAFLGGRRYDCWFSFCRKKRNVLPPTYVALSGWSRQRRTRQKENRYTLSQKMYKYMRYAAAVVGDRFSLPVSVAVFSSNISFFCFSFSILVFWMPLDVGMGKCVMMRLLLYIFTPIFKMKWRVNLTAVVFIK